MFKKVFKFFIKVLIFIFLALSVLPYAIIDTAEDEFKEDNLFKNSEFILIDGINLHYRTWEPTNEIKGYVLLVHGFGGSTYSWRNSIDNLTELGYYAVAFDLPGFGYSDRAVLSDDELNQIISEFVNQIAKDNNNSLQWSLIGHSMGSRVISNYAIYDENVERLIFVDGALQNSDTNSLGILLKYPPAREWMKHIISKIYLTEERIEGFLSEAYGREPTQEEITMYLKPLLLENTTSNLIELSRKNNKVNIESLNNLSTSTHAIWGEDDTTTPVSIMNDLKTVLEDFDTYVIQDAAHCPMETHSDEFNVMLEKILD